MKFILSILVFFSFNACKQASNKEQGESLELILLGFREDFDMNHPTRFGAREYFRFDGSDTLLVKACTYLNESTGEPILPVTCKYFAKNISLEQKSKFNYFISYLKPLSTGELIKNRPKETYCDVFGAWIVIYTNKDMQKKHFVFDCYGIPDSIHQLCNELTYYRKDADNSYLPIDAAINTDSIVQASYKILENDFLKRRPKNLRNIKFASPKERSGIEDQQRN